MKLGPAPLVFAFGLCACGASDGVRFLVTPSFEAPFQTLVLGYLTRQGVEVRVSSGEGPTEFAQPETSGDQLQVLAYEEAPEALGLTLGAVAPPADPCVRSCALLAPRVLSARFVDEGWSPWAPAAAEPRLLEDLLPAAARGRCEACLEFEQTSISLTTELPASFLAVEPGGRTALLGLPTGAVLRIDEEGGSAQVCELTPERHRAAAFLASGELLLGGEGGSLTIVDTLAGCEVLSSTQSPSRQPIAHLAVHPTSSAFYLLTTGGRLERYRPADGFELLAELPATHDASLGGVVFDQDGAVFAVNGSTSFAHGRESVTVAPVRVESGIMNDPPSVRGVIFHALTRQVLVSIDAYGLFAYGNSSFSRLASDPAELSGLTPYGVGVIGGQKNGVVRQYTPGSPECPRLLVGSRRTPRLLVTLGPRVLVGDPYTARSDENLSTLPATLLIPADACLAQNLR